MMKAFKVNRIMTSIRRRGEHESDTPPAENTGDDGPEAIASRSVKQFCESNHNGVQGDEVLFLPPIVEAAESSPAAAAVCAKMLRHYLSRDYSTRPACQYNSLMLIRILVDNPGQTFTRNLDRKFADAAKDLLRNTKNDGIRSMLMETLDFFEKEKNWDEGLQPSVEMWKKEREKSYKILGQKAPSHAPTRPSMPSPAGSLGPPLHHSSSKQQQQQTRSSSSSRRLPHPAELASRLEEARNSAKLLTQLVANTDAAAIISDELVREFADRCQSALRNVQAYMKAENPPPDTDTMESLIDTSEQVQSAINQHQRAVLSARKQLGTNERRESPPSPLAEPVAPATAPIPAPSETAAAPNGNSARPHWDTSLAFSDEQASNPAPAPAPASAPAAAAAASSSLSGYGAGLGSPKGKGVYVSSTTGGSSSTAQAEWEPERDRGPSPETPLEDPFQDPHHDYLASASASRWDNDNGYSRYDVRTGSSSGAPNPYPRREPLVAEQQQHHPLSWSPSASSLSGVAPPPGPPPTRSKYDDISDDDDLYDSRSNRASVHGP